VYFYLAAGATGTHLSAADSHKQILAENFPELVSTLLSANLNDPTAVAASLQLLGLNNLDDVRLLDFEEQSELRIALRGAEILLGDRSRLRRMLNEDQESASTRVFEAVELKRPISRRLQAKESDGKSLAMDTLGEEHNILHDMHYDSTRSTTVLYVF
jgi:hypothetical protein